jgi:hypothetical protein
MPTHTIVSAYQTPGASVSGQQVVTADQEINADYTWASAPTNKEIDLALDESALQSLCLHSTAAGTLYTNEASTGNPRETIALEANVPKIYKTAAECQALLGGDVTKVFFTSAVAAGTLKIYSLSDITP